MPRGGHSGRGAKKNYKGQRRHFTSPEELQVQAEQEKKKKEWRKKQGIESDESEEDEQPQKSTTGQPGDLPPSYSSEEESSDDEDQKQKGVSHLIQVANPNRSGNREHKKISEMSVESSANLSRREREELEKQAATARYRQLHMQGKTDEARADLARLAIIKKQREEAAAKRDAQLKAKEPEKKKGANS